MSALRYHPDRNPGKELEFIAEFQAIQAAHEILSDPQQRMKYDTARARLRAGYGKYYSTSGANTSRKTSAGGYNFASGPKPPPFSARPQPFQNGPSTGARRYASYARAAPQRPWGKKHDEGQARADAYRGFQGMKNSPSMPGRGGFANSGQSPRPKSAYEYFEPPPMRGGNNTGPSRSHTSARRKQGFTPGTAGGDEPMAANTSAYSSVPREEGVPGSNNRGRPSAQNGSPWTDQTNAHDARSRELACPNPPKQPHRPDLAPTGIGAQLALPRPAWERYVGELNTYMREWDGFNRRILQHFSARQEANESAIEEDVQIQKHWDVACELHWECILELRKLQIWISNGGKLI